MTLDQLRLYVKVIEAGSFALAAERLQTPRSHVSRVIAQLEAELGVVLLERTTRTRSITEAGREVYERAVGILGAVDETLRATQRLHEEPRGLLRLTCGVEFGMITLGSWIEDYVARYPHVAVDVEYTSRELDLVHEGFELAIRSGPLPDSRLVARPLGRFEYGLFASTAYLDLPDALRDGRRCRGAGPARAGARTLAPAGGGGVRALSEQPLPDAQGARVRRTGAGEVPAARRGPLRVELLNANSALCGNGLKALRSRSDAPIQVVAVCLATGDGRADEAAHRTPMPQGAASAAAGRCRRKVRTTARRSGPEPRCRAFRAMSR